MLEKLLSVAFYACMGVYFLYSFFFPAQTDFWLARWGPIVIFMELFWMVGVAALSDQISKKLGLVTDHKDKSLRMLIFLLAAIFIISLKSEIWIFIYFIFSLALKFFEIRSRQQLYVVFDALAVSFILWILAAITGRILSDLSPLSPSQINAYWTYFNYPPDGPPHAWRYELPTYAFIGFTYFILMAVRSALPIDDLFSRWRQKRNPYLDEQINHR